MTDIQMLQFGGAFVMLITGNVLIAVVWVLVSFFVLPADQVPFAFILFWLMCMYLMFRRASR